MNVTIFLNRDNVITFGLLEDRVPVDALLITQVDLQFKPRAGGSPVLISSASVPALFDFTTTEDFSGEVIGVLKLMLGAMAGVAVGRYTMKVIIYDPVNTGGITWGLVNATVRDDSL